MRNQKCVIHPCIGSTYTVCDCSDRTKSTSRCLDLGPRILLRVLPSLDEPGHKFILSSVNFRPLCAYDCCRAAQPLGFASVSRHQWLWLDLQRDHVEFHLVKSQGLQGHDQYQWQVVDENADGTGQLSVSYEGKGDGVQAYDQAGVLVSAIDLCRGAYCTVIKFSWSSKIYRYPAQPGCCLLAILHAVMLML